MISPIRPAAPRLSAPVRPLQTQEPIPDPQPQPNPDPHKGFRESLVGSAWHTAAGAAVGGVVGAAIGRGRGAVWGASIGAAAAQGFMQFLTRVADGGVPKAAAIPGALAAAGGAAGALAAGAAGAAVGIVAGPLAVLGYFYGVRWLANRIGG